MSKYFPNNAAITAVLYEHGLETGYINGNQTIAPENGKYTKEQHAQIKEGNFAPYIATAKGNIVIDPKVKDLYVVTHADGSVSTMNQKDLKASYTAGK